MRHKLIIHGEVKSSCEQCDYKYKTKKHLTIHKLSVHDEKINCDHCDDQAAQPSNLKKHKLSQGQVIWLS